MNKTEIITNYNRINSLLSQKLIAEALSVLKKMIADTTSDEFNVIIEGIEQTYTFVLKYAIKGVEDPQRPFIVNQLIKSLFELNDKVKEYHLDKATSEISYKKKQMMSNNKLITNRIREIQEDIHFHKEMEDLIKGIAIEDKELENFDYNFLVNEYFNYVWLTDIFSEEESHNILAFFNSDVHAWHTKSLIVSALGLNAIRYFHPQKILLLIELVKKGTTQISERAFVGLMFALYMFNKRLSFYPEVEAALLLLSDDNPQTEMFTHFFLFQMIKAADTEKFTKKFREEIMPDIIKNAPGLKDKLDLDNILPEDLEEGKNPDWQKIIGENSDLMGKLEELSKLQMEGTDVFMGTFAMLKHFPFFNQMTHWFIPFYKENTVVEHALDSENNEFREIFLAALEKSGHMCNSDKYSFCLNIKDLPDAQKKMMLNMFKQELDSINEINEQDDMINKSLISKRIFMHYIQDIYRFFKLYSGKSNFTDVFSKMQNFHQKDFFNKYFSGNELLLKAADFYFESNHFEQASEIFNMLTQKGYNTKIVFEKAAYAYQQRGMYEEAICHYKKAELFECSVWINRNIALCYTKLDDFEQALIYYHEAEKAEPDNMKTQLSIANTYLNMGETETALNYYYKLELLANSNIKVLRPISWCLFVLGRFEEAENYFIQLIKSRQANHYDTMNYAHLLWCNGKGEEAASLYKKSINLNNNNFDNFLKSFNEDKKHLLKHGIKEDDLTLMLDYLKLNIS